MKEPLFARKSFTSHSGVPLEWKIDCDALSDVDIATIAYVISKRWKFRWVYGIPTGGSRLAEALLPWTTEVAPSDPQYPHGQLPILIADDVLTTGASMEEAYNSIVGDKIGVVIFARGPHASWIHPIFTVNL